MKTSTFKIPKEDLTKALTRFLDDKNYLESLMSALASVGEVNPHFIGFKIGTYNAFKSNPKYAAGMCMLAGFALGYEIKSLEGTCKRRTKKSKSSKKTLIEFPSRSA
jgi:hypothetical protein